MSWRRSRHIWLRGRLHCNHPLTPPGAGEDVCWSANCACLAGHRAPGVQWTSVRSELRKLEADQLHRPRRQQYVPVHSWQRRSREGGANGQHLTVAGWGALRQDCLAAGDQVPTVWCIPGKFIQVELMLKDASDYKDTEGWGWGRWRGLGSEALRQRCALCKRVHRLPPAIAWQRLCLHVANLHGKGRWPRRS